MPSVSEFCLFPGDEFTPISGCGFAASAKPQLGGLPLYVRRLWAKGNQFNAQQAAKYPFNEVYVDSAGSVYPLRLDSYNPRLGEIVFRRFTQLASVQEQTAINYINEAVSKYAPGTKLADVPTNQRLFSMGRELTGRLYFEVPVQNKPIPQSILDFATKRDVLIRDMNGTVYNARPSP